jgi:hypothetical protein
LSREVLASKDIYLLIFIYHHCIKIVETDLSVIGSSQSGQRKTIYILRERAAHVILSLCQLVFIRGLAPPGSRQIAPIRKRLSVIKPLAEIKSCQEPEAGHLPMIKQVRFLWLWQLQW